MKKTIFCLAAGVMALSACTSTDVIEEGIQGNAIGFQNVVSKNSRAINQTSDLKNFYVYGYYTRDNQTLSPVGVFDEQLVEFKGDKWQYSPERYWVPASTYYFYALSCDNKPLDSNYGTAGIDLDSNNTTPATRALTIKGYQCNAAHNDDLIFAYAEGIDSDKAENAANHDAVSLNFKHLLSKINIKFQSGFAEGYDIKVTGVKFENIYDKADYSGTTLPVWSNFSKTTPATNNVVNFAVPEANVVAKATTDTDGNAVAEKTFTTAVAYVIPHDYQDTQVRLVFNVEITNGETNVLSTTLTGRWTPTWITGTAYTYTVVISGDTANLDPIVFETSTVGEWDKPENDNDPSNVVFNFGV